MLKHISFERNKMLKLVERIPEESLDDCYYMVARYIGEIKDPELDAMTKNEIIDAFLESTRRQYEQMDPRYKILKMLKKEAEKQNTTPKID